MSKVSETIEIRDANFVRVFEPGDGTRYTLMHAFAGGDVFMAIGAGEKIEGGYWLTQDTIKYSLNKIRGYLIADDRVMFKAAVEDYIDQNRAYWNSHAGVKNKWTATVALLAILLAYLRELQTSYSFIGYVYHDDWQNAFDSLRKRQQVMFGSALV